MIKKECPGLSNVIMVGDKRKYNIILCTAKTKIDGEGNPLDVLVGEAKLVDASCKTVKDIQSSPAWSQYIQRAVDIYNAQATSNAHKVSIFVTHLQHIMYSILALIHRTGAILPHPRQ